MYMTHIYIKTSNFHLVFFFIVLVRVDYNNLGKKHSHSISELKWVSECMLAMNVKIWTLWL